MPLVFGAITPHSPVLIPTIGQKNYDKPKKTLQALKTLEENLYTTKPHTIIVLSSHSNEHHDSFVINAHTHFLSSFEKFGDHSTKTSYTGSPDFAAHLSHHALTEQIPLKLISKTTLDHGTSVPLFHLTSHLPDIKVIPIGSSDLSPKKHLEFGKLIKEISMNSDRRIAIVASADLSHVVTTDAPLGFRESGKKFDEKIIELLESHNTAGIATLDPAFVTEAATCGYQPILLLLGVLQNMDYEFKHLSYEAPFGIGYLTAKFILS